MAPDEAGLARLTAERWFGGKDRRLTALLSLDALRTQSGGLTVVEVEYEDGEPDLYTLLEPEGGGFWAELLCPLARDRAGSAFRLDALPALGDVCGLPDRPLGIDQSNSSFVLGERLVLKCYRRLWPGPHPEVELVSYLGGEAECGHVPAAAGCLHWGDPPYALALLQAYVPGAEDGWAWAADTLVRSLAGEPVATTTAWAGELGAVTAELHDALAAGFGTRLAAPTDLEGWSRRAEALLGQVADLDELAPALRAELAVLGAARQAPLTRIHGDLHVGQVLRSPAGYRVIDFEGEPTRPPDERRALDSPLRDVASMVRSFDNLARWTLRGNPAGDETAARAWVEEARARFLDAYARCRPIDGELLRALEVEKAVYELAYAASFLPEWAEVARPALCELVGSRA